MPHALQPALAVLRSHADELRGRGVRRAAVFGSVARGQATGASDIDVLVELDDAARLDLLDYVAIRERLAELLGEPIDVVNQRTLKPGLRDRILHEAVYAF